MQKKTVDTLFINWGESFVETASTETSILNGATPQIERFFLPKNPLKKILSSYIGIKRIVISTKLAQTILQKKMGMTPAYLVTSGFEKWLEINRPIQENYFTLLPTQQSALTHEDLIFSIQERLQANGDCLKPIKIEELKFLHEKLKLNEVKTICLNFLHASKNPENENLASKFFSENGYKVFSSSNTTQIKGANSVSQQERPRWLAALINAYIYPTWCEEFITLENYLQEIGIQNQVPIEIVQNDGTIKNWKDSFPLDTFFGSEYLISQNPVHEPQQCIFLGLESFQIFDNTKSSQDTWNSEHGLVQIPHTLHSSAIIQPTSSIEENFWKSPQISNKVMGYEPGPMCFGKSQKTTLMDIFYVNGGVKNVPGLSDILSEKTIPRIHDSLFGFNKNSRNSEILFSLAVKTLASQLALMPKNFVTLKGPLAATLENGITQSLKSKKIHKAKNWEYPIINKLVEEYLN